MATDLVTQYESLSRETWRVSFTEDAPDVRIERLEQELERELPRFAMPVDVDVIDVKTNEGIRRRLRVKHREDTYGLLHIIIGIEDFGKFVFASQSNFLVQAPEMPDALRKPEPSYKTLAFLAGVAIIFGCAALAAVDSALALLLGLLIVAGLGVMAQRTYAAKQAYRKQRAEWQRQLSQYWSYMERSFLSDMDDTLFRLQSATRAVIEMVLKRMFPQAEDVGKAEETLNNTQTARDHLREQNAKFKGGTPALKR